MHINCRFRPWPRNVQEVRAFVRMCQWFFFSKQKEERQDCIYKLFFNRKKNYAYNTVLFHLLLPARLFFSFIYLYIKVKYMWNCPVFLHGSIGIKNNMFLFFFQKMRQEIFAAPRLLMLGWASTWGCWEPRRVQFGHFKLFFDCFCFLFCNDPPPTPTHTLLLFFRSCIYDCFR